MIKAVKWRGVIAASFALLFTTTGSAQTAELPVLPAGAAKFLTQPYLQNPTESGVNVVWLTNFEGRHHWLIVEDEGPGYGKGKLKEWIKEKRNGKKERSGDTLVRAQTAKLERLLEDGSSRIELDLSQVHQRIVYRHEAVVRGLKANESRRYWVKSIAENGDVLETGPYTLQALPEPGRPLEILLSSDQQERFNTLANYQKVEENFPELDAIFFAGDLANHPRRASEWFDNYLESWHQNPRAASPAFFQAMQGTFAETVPESPYRGGALLQNVPLFPSIANHEVSGRFRPNERYVLNGQWRTANINSMFDDPQPRWYAEHKYKQVADEVNPHDRRDVKEQWIRDASNDFEVYRDLFTLPDDGPEGESYYSKQVGDVFLISMNVSRIWRNWNIGENDRSKFVEMLSEANNPDAWGFGEHIFTPFAEGSQQYEWLKKTLRSREFKNSKYRVVMFHQSAHGLGDNAVPVLTDPVMHLQYTDEDGQTRLRQVIMPIDTNLRQEVFKNQVEPLLGSIQQVRYEYPINADYFRRDIEPLMHKYGVQLVLTGHSHVWNRSKEGNVNFLETSSVGNCFGAFWTLPDGSSWSGRQRIGGQFAEELELGAELSRWDPKNYPRIDDPHNRKQIMPTLANPMMVFEGEPEPLPFVCSNNISTFSILDSGMGAVRSFAFDVREPDAELIEFDRFSLHQ